MYVTILCFDRRMICGHIGDGLIAESRLLEFRLLLCRRMENCFNYLLRNFKSAADYLRLTKGTIDDVHAIVLMTDGVQDSVYDETSGLVKP